jgi:hypothetical protein
MRNDIIIPHPLPLVARAHRYHREMLSIWPDFLKEKSGQIQFLCEADNVSWHLDSNNVP